MYLPLQYVLCTLPQNLCISPCYWNLLTSVDYLCSKYPDIGILITGDFNHMNISQLTHGNDLYQMVDFHTATLDLVIVSDNLRVCYEKPHPLSPLGLSDQQCILWKPYKLYRVVTHECKTLITRPLLESGMCTFGSWIQNLDWHQVLEASGT